MKSLVLNSLIFICFSCASYTKEFKEIEKSTEIYTPFYLNNFKEESFKIAIDVNGNHYGGILIAKRIETNHYRFVLINEFGGKLMDFELKQNQLKLNYALEQLNKKLILKLLEKDFSMIFSENNKIENQYSFDNKVYLDTSLENQRLKLLYEFQENPEKLTSIVQIKKREKAKAIVHQSGNLISEIEISHGKIPIKIYLHLLVN